MWKMWTNLFTAITFTYFHETHKCSSPNFIYKSDESVENRATYNLCL